MRGGTVIAIGGIRGDVTKRKSGLGGRGGWDLNVLVVLYVNVYFVAFCTCT